MIHNKPLFHVPHHHHPHSHGAGGPGGAGQAGPVAVTGQVGVTGGQGGLDVNINLNVHIDLHAPPPHNCWLPPPCREQSSPPAGQGLTKAPEFGANAIRTAGGYTIVPETKDAAWSIYAPGQKPGDTPNTRVWGDPHVTEKDGTRWDFTKNSDFRLGDGTVISVKTTAQEGQSVSSSLDITNGLDRVQVTGLDKSQPSVGAVTHDGYQARAELTDKDTFILGGDKDHVQWFRERNGKVEGEVVSAKLTTIDGKKLYEQDVNASSQYVIDPSLQPKVGTPAWGNMLRDEAVDLSRKWFGAGSVGAELTGLGAAVDHAKNTPEAREARQQQMDRFHGQLGSLMQLFKLLDLMNSIGRRPSALNT